MYNKDLRFGPMSEAHKLKISLANKGRIFTAEHKKKISLSCKGRRPNKTSFKKGNISWQADHKKIKECIVCGKEFQVIWSRDFVRCCSRECSHKITTQKNRNGIYQNCLNCKKEFYVPKHLQGIAKYCSRQCKDKHIWSVRREEVIKNLSKSHLGQNAWNKGKKFPEYSGENHPNWNGGSSFEEYGREFNQDLKDKIKQRDNHRCILCGLKESKKSYIVHHIDYDKKNNKEENLILLCNSCHSKTNHNRQQWKNIFNRG